jgi:6-phosphogluconolactonase
MSSSAIVVPATVHVFPSKSTIGLNVAKRVADISSNAIRERGRVLVAISGGSLPSILASGLLATTEDGGDASTIASTIDWSKWDVFFADERIVPLDHDDSNYQECNKVMFSKVAGSKEATADLLTRVHTITMGNPADVAATYQAEVEAALDSSGGAFDLVLLGMGPDGHTGESLFFCFFVFVIVARSLLVRCSLPSNFFCSSSSTTFC